MRWSASHWRSTAAGSWRTMWYATSRSPVLMRSSPRSTTPVDGHDHSSACNSAAARAWCSVLSICWVIQPCRSGTVRLLHGDPQIDAQPTQPLPRKAVMAAVHDRLPYSRVFRLVCRSEQQKPLLIRPRRAAVAAGQFGTLVAGGWAAELNERVRVAADHQVALLVPARPVTDGFLCLLGRVVAGVIDGDGGVVAEAEDVVGAAHGCSPCIGSPVWLGHGTACPAASMSVLRQAPSGAMIVPNNLP